MPEKPALILSGPSGIGKSTLSYQLEGYGFKNVLKTTTRPPRINEIDGVDYEFTDRESFLQGSQAGEFIIADNLYGNYYGTKSSQLEEVRRDGGIPMLQLYMPTIDRVLGSLPDAHTVFMRPVSIEFLAARLKKRVQSKEEYEYRLAQTTKELEEYSSRYKQYYRTELCIDSDDNRPHIERIRVIYEAHPSSQDLRKHI